MKEVTGQLKQQVTILIGSKAKNSGKQPTSVN
jgi:hypothetical protein